MERPGVNESPGLPILIAFKSFLTCARSAALNVCPDLSGNARTDSTFNSRVPR